MATIATMAERPLKFALCLAVFGSFVGCSLGSTPHRSETVLVVSGEMGGLDCVEFGFADETDGAMSLSEECSCASPELRYGSREGLDRRLWKTAQRRGANAIWILESWGSVRFGTHLERCCYVEGFRALAFLYRCSALELEAERDRASSVTGGESWVLDSRGRRSDKGQSL